MKKAAKQIKEKSTKRSEKTYILLFDKMCVNFKNIWLWTAVDRKSKELTGFEIGTRDTRYFENLSEKTSHVDPKKYATDRYVSYILIDQARRLIGKAPLLYTVEQIKLLLYRYLPRFARKTYC